MPTIHYSKKQFIKELENFIGEDEHIILSTEVDGTLQLKKKRGIKQIPFAFAADGFEEPNSVHDLLKTKMFSFLIAPDSVVAEKFKKNADTKKG